MGYYNLNKLLNKKINIVISPFGYGRTYYENKRKNRKCLIIRKYDSNE